MCYISCCLGALALQVDSPPKQVKPSSIAGMNAFQLINAALDLSAMFERRSDVVHRHTRFTSKMPPAVLLDHLQDAVRHLKGTTKRVDNRWGCWLQAQAARPRGLCLRACVLCASVVCM